MLAKAKELTLFSMTEGYRHLYAGAAFAMFGTSLFMFSAPLLGGAAIDVINKRDLAAGNSIVHDLVTRLNYENPIVTYLILAALLSVLLTCVAGGFLYLRGLWAAVASESIIRNLRETIYRHLHQVQANFYDTAETGDLVQRSSSDVETVRVFLASDLVEMGRAIMLVATVFPILFLMNWQLALVSMCLFPVLTVGAYVFFSKVKHVFELTDKADGAMTSCLQENLTGIRVVRAFARQSYESAKFGTKNAIFRDHNYRLIRLMAYYWSTSDLFAMTQIGLVLFVGAGYVSDGTMSEGDLFIFITCVSMVIWPVRQLGRVLTDTGKAVVALTRINAVIGTQEEQDYPAPAIQQASGAITLRDLCFSYQPALPTLTELNLFIPAGETLAIIGPPGSGKSTFIRLLLKLYDYSSGSLKVDNLEVREINRHWLRQQISVVLQEPFLYSKSIEENIVVGLPEANAEELRRACEDAAVLETIEGFQKGFAANVGERGVTLSGGQRQRLALARALIKNPPILVLDDSLSAVDTGTEQLILNALERRHGLRTTLIIAHRLSSIVHADRILVLEDGVITQLGTHQELINQPGFYGRLCALQQTLDASILQDIKTGRKENV